MEVGKYKDYNTYLPLCKEQTEQIGKMVTEILDASKLSASISSEETQSFDIANYLKELCGQYQLISNANGQQFKINIASEMQVCLPPKTFAKAISNILANAVAYTEQGKAIVVTLNGHNIIVENECQPIPTEHLKRIFEPFYRPDYARNRADGGNGLGLYIVASILDTLHCSYSFSPMDKPLGMRFVITLP